jgi:transposase-like protein
MHRSREQWAALVAAFEETDQTVARFCARRGIHPKTFAWWRWQLRDTSRPRRSDSGVRLLPVDVVDGRGARDGCVVVAMPELEVRFDVGADVDYVAALVSRLRQA